MTDTPARQIGDRTWTYIIQHETWYAPFKDDPPTIGVHATDDDGSAKWEFQLSEHDYNGSCIQLSLFSDAYAAFGDIPEFFEALRDEKPASLAHVRAILDRLGAHDTTERISPRKAGAR